MARALNILGIVYGESGELLGALRAFLDADVLCKELEDHAGEADALNNIGNVYAYLGDFVNTLDYHQQSLVVCEKYGYGAAKSRALLNIGVAYFELEQHNEALGYFSSMLTLMPGQDPHLHALLLLNLGRTERQLGQLSAARSYLEQSLTLNQTLKDTLGVSYVLDALAELDLKAENRPSAYLRLQESFALKEAAGDVRGQSETLLLLATADEAHGDPDAATARLHNALEVTEQVGNPRERYRAYRHLSDICERQGRYQEALGYYRRYNELHEQVSRGAVGQQLQGLRLRFEVSQTAREREIYHLKNDELSELNRALKAADEKSQLLVKLERQAEEDALTELYNRRYFDTRFAHSFAEAKRLETLLSAVILDIDNFKGINDRFSHQTGDAVLRTVAALMKAGVRAIDTVARYGGEEFVMLLPGASAESAAAICERFRVRVETYNWERLQSGLRVTLSIGISADLSAENHERTLTYADAKLYEAKRSGKNRVCV